MRDRHSRVIPVVLGLALALGVSVACSAAEAVRFVSVQPVSPGEWVATLAGAKDLAKLSFRADGVALSAQVSGDKVRLTGVPTGIRRLEVFPAGAREASAALRLAGITPAEAPFADWTIYQLLLDMWKNGSPGNDGAAITGWKHPRYAGGDLQGLRAEMGALSDLGVNAVWLSPLFAARSSHGYDVTNYYRVADALAVPGDPKASQELFDGILRELHAKGLKVILDIPLNHAAAAYQRPEGDPQGLQPRATGPRQEAEKLWDSWGSGYKYWDFDHPPTRKFLTGVALHWLTKVGGTGVDGLRLDYVRGVPHDYWAELYAAVHQAKPAAYLVGECWLDAGGPEANEREIATYYEQSAGPKAQAAAPGPQLDSLLDFPLQMVMTDVFARGDAASGLETWLQSEAAVYPAGALPTYFLDNHDLSRFLSWTDATDRLVAAVGFMASLSGPVVLLYGTEEGLTHGGPKPGFTDVGRIPMPWKGGNPELHKKIAAILKARREHPALTRGGRLPLRAEKDLLVMAKVGATETALVGVNLSAQAKELDLDLGSLLPAGAQPATVWGDAPATAGAQAGSLHWKLPPWSTSVVAWAGGR